MLLTLAAVWDSKDPAAFVLLIPTIAMIVRSIIMYKEKQNGTTS